MHRERSHGLLSAAFALLVIAVLVVVGLMVGSRAINDVLEEQIRKSAEQFAGSLQAEMENQGAQIKIYDSDEKLLSVLMPEGASYSLNPIWSDIASKACGDVSAVVLHDMQNSEFYSETVNALDKFPAAMKPILDRLVDENEIGLEAVNAIIPQEVQISHILNTTQFGALGEGIISASYELFAASPDILSMEQFELLMQFVGNDDSVDNILKLEAQAAGMELSEFKDVMNVSSSSPSAAYGVNQLVTELLEEVAQQQGVALSELGDLSVKTSINSTMQKELQQLVDKMLSSNVDLGSDGTLAEECAIVVVDPAKSNCIVAYVPSRTGRDGSQREVQFKNAQMNADLATAEKYISEKKTSVSLIEWKDQKGVSQPTGLDIIVKEHLSEVATAEPQSIIAAYEEFSDEKLAIVVEVQDSSGKTIYTAEPNAGQNSLNDMIREELLTDTDGIMRLSAETGTGSVKFWQRSDFGVGIYSGAYAQGYTGSKADINDIAMEVNEVVQTYYKLTAQKKVVSNAVQSVMVSNKKENLALVQEEMQKKFSDLQGIAISTTQDVDAFEALYSSITVRLSELTPYLNQDDINALSAQQASIRKQKSNELVSAAA